MTTITLVPAIPVPAGDAPWAITDENDAAVVRHAFNPGITPEGDAYLRRIAYWLPHRSQPVDFADNAAIVNVDPACVVRWSSFEDHLKADVVFTRRPDVPALWFAVDLDGVELLAEPGGDLRLIDAVTGERVGMLPRPFLLDADRTRHTLAWTVLDGALWVDLPDLDDDLWVGAVFDPTTIDTSTSASPTGFGNQKGLVRLTGGQLVAVFSSNGTNAEFWYSSDNGTTWTQFSGSDIAGWANGSIATYTDSGGVQRLVVYWKQSGTGGSRSDEYTYCMTGALNAGATTLTWGTAVAIWSLTIAGGHDLRFPDLVVHAEGTGGRAHLVVGRSTSGNLVAEYDRYNIDSSGVLSTASAAADLGTYTGSMAQQTFPTIALNAATKDLYVAWSAGTTGSGNGIRFKKATYSAGPAWSWGTEREIDNARYIDGLTGARWLRCLYDGTRAVMVGELYDGANYDVVAHERDAGDTATTARELAANVSTETRLDFGSASFDADGNLYIFGVNQDEAAGSKDLVYRKWTRSGASYGSEVVLDATVGDAYISAKVGYANTRIEIIYRDLNASPYDVRYEAVLLNQPPSTATWDTTAGAKDIAASLLLDWTFVDTDSGDTQSAYALKRDIGGTVRWWNGTDWSSTVETYNTSSTSAVTLAASWGADSDANHNYYVITKDAAGVAAAAYSAALVITPSAKVNPVIDTPADAGTVATTTITPTWTVAQQSAYQLRLLTSGGAELWTSGWVTDTVARSRSIVYTMANSTTYKVELTTRNTEGLDSTADTNTFSTSFTVPATPTLVTSTPGGTEVYVRVVITNPGPTGSQPAISGNDLYRREVGDTDAGIRIASGVASGGTYDDYAVASGVAYEYLARALGTTTVTKDSAWTA